MATQAHKGLWVLLLCSMTGIVSSDAVAGDQYCEPHDPTPGIRQRWWKGKPWPPQPRSVGPKASFTDQYHYSHYWPYPHTCQDRDIVRSALEQQVANGWVEQTTLYDQHFDLQTNELNAAGRRHLMWILLHAPPMYRAAYVATTETPELSQARLVNTQLAASQILGAENTPPIMLRASIPQGASAQELDLIRRKWLSTLPDPRLDYTAPTNSAPGAQAP